MARINEVMAALDFDSVSKEFSPYVEHSKSADAINVYFRPDPDYSERLCEHVTLFRSIDTGELVGCRIKGISGIVEDLPNYVGIKHKDIELRLIFLTFRGSAADEDSRSALNELVRHAGGLKLATHTA